MDRRRFLGTTILGAGGVISGIPGRLSAAQALERRDGYIRHEEGRWVIGTTAVEKVVRLENGRLTLAARRAHQRQRWFKRAQRWPTGCEGWISALKRRHGLKRCRYRGLQGMERWVGWAVLANNLLVLTRSASPPKSGGGGK